MAQDMRPEDAGADAGADVLGDDALEQVSGGCAPTPDELVVGRRHHHRYETREWEH